MDIPEYWVGQIPSKPIVLDVRDNEGNSVVLSNYSEFKIILLDESDKAVDLTGSSLSGSGMNDNKLVFRFPSNRSVFQRPGGYLLQLQLNSLTGARDYTDALNIKVRKLGGTNNVRYTGER